MSPHATTVINMRDAAAVREARSRGVYVRIDRATKWGNPFARLGTRSKYQVRYVADPLGAYRAHVLNSPELLAALPELRGTVLGCWCKPGPCHGDVLVELVNRGVTA